MFTIHILRNFYEKKEWTYILRYLKQVVTVGVNQIHFLICFSLIYFSDIYKNVKYK